MSKTKFNTSDIRKIEELMKIDIIDDRFQCKQCSKLILNPKTCKTCNVNFCSNCYDIKNPKCNTCNNELIETDLFIKYALLILPIKCPYNCDDQITVQSLNQHIQICINRVQNCIVQNCKFQDEKNKLNLHYKDQHKDIQIFDCQKCTILYVGTERHDCIKNVKNLIKQQKDQIYSITSQLQASKVLIHYLNTEILKLEEIEKEKKQEKEQQKEEQKNEVKQELQNGNNLKCQHPLRWIFPIKNVKCEICQIKGNTTRYTCDECEKYYCELCVKPKFTSKYQCPDGHQLKFQQQPLQGYLCDFCRKSPYRENVSMLSDRNCDFDVCYTCFTKYQSN